ncbi:hypothetical protein UCYN_07190 [Candidatus Atelocyanobacterium thalassa isolate ALOHA]|uniref:Uncharacterized protein n=1 Tax=Atelocyanobacterium thalassa (isolate ALOHA) TaxID=1453429 RepID=D3EPL5_ATETH|nr:hypothetical protein UCYN_07190 [Candidatus Atelocyanobacterium thalassa isolate ALOHA]
MIRILRTIDKFSKCFHEKLKEVKKENHRIKLKNYGKFLQTVIQ